MTASTVVVAGAIAVALTGCARGPAPVAPVAGPTAAPCTRGFTSSIAPDFSGTPDPEGALAAWLALDPSDSSAPEAGTQLDEWSRGDDDEGDRVVFVNDSYEVTASRSTRGEWAVTTVSCADWE